MESPSRIRELGKKLKVEKSGGSAWVDQIDFFGVFSESNNQRYLVAWSDFDPATQRGGFRESGLGTYILAEDGNVTVAGSLQRPNDGKVADNGTFILNDWMFGGGQKGMFLAFDNAGNNLIHHQFPSCLYSNGISPGGEFAVCQLCNGILAFFDLRSRILLWEKTPETGMANDYSFDIKKQLLVVYDGMNEHFSYSFDGLLVDQEKWERVSFDRASAFELHRRARENLAMAKRARDESSLPGILELLSIALQRSLSEYPNEQAAIYRTMGEITEMQGKPDKALAFYEIALSLNPKVGLKRRVAAMKAARPHCEARLAKPPGLPPPPPPIPESRVKPEQKQSDQDATTFTLTPGQIQFLKKIRDTPLTRELLDYYKNSKCYQDLIGGDIEAFLLKVSDFGYIEKTSGSPEAWHCTKRGRQATMFFVEQARAGEDELEQALSTLEASESLKIATELKRECGLNAAIEALKISYEKIRNSQVAYTVETFLMLPEYLHAAGRSDEAWGYLNTILAKGYPNQTDNDGLRARDRSAIYSAMSTFLHKESKNLQAITLQSLSAIAWAESHYLQAIEYDSAYEKELRQEALEQFIRWSQPAEVLDSLHRSVPKKSSSFNLDRVASHICEILGEPEQIKYDIAFVEIDRIIHEDNKSSA